MNKFPKTHICPWGQGHSSPDGLVLTDRNGGSQIWVCIETFFKIHMPLPHAGRFLFHVSITLSWLLWVFILYQGSYKKKKKENWKHSDGNHWLEEMDLNESCLETAEHLPNRGAFFFSLVILCISQDCVTAFLSFILKIKHSVWGFSPTFNSVCTFFEPLLVEKHHQKHTSWEEKAKSSDKFIMLFWVPALCNTRGLQGFEKWRLECSWAGARMRRWEMPGYPWHSLLRELGVDFEKLHTQ